MAQRGARCRVRCLSREVNSCASKALTQGPSGRGPTGRRTAGGGRRSPTPQPPPTAAAPVFCPFPAPSPPCLQARGSKQPTTRSCHYNRSRRCPVTHITASRQSMPSAAKYAWSANALPVILQCRTIISCMCQIITARSSQLLPGGLQIRLPVFGVLHSRNP